MMELLFRRPGELVLGDETADEAADRFEQACSRRWPSPGRNVAIVSHGTVIALLCREGGRGSRPGARWAAVVRRAGGAGFKLEKMVARIP